VPAPTTGLASALQDAEARRLLDAQGDIPVGNSS
jgi:hypothetical protein